MGPYGQSFKCPRVSPPMPCPNFFSPNRLSSENAKEAITHLFSELHGRGWRYDGQSGLMRRHPKLSHIIATFRRSHPLKQV
jgi:hypothetical protein